MRDGHRIVAVIPALNEERSIGNVLTAIPDWVDRVIVADNGSHDGTPEAAADNGADVVHEPRRGYGSACLAGIAAIDAADIVVFLDADYSDHPDQMARLVDPIVGDAADLVIGSRALGICEPSALTPQARFGNMLACFLIRLFWGVRFTDLGPFRAIRYSTLQALGMRDPDYGWTVEMQIKAVLAGVRCAEAPVDYRKRVGRSKVSGTVRGVLGAGYKILGTIFLTATREMFRKGRAAKPGVSPGSRVLAVFTRFPEPGATKTRLIPALGAESAAQLQRDMTEHVVAESRKLENVRVEVHFTCADADSLRAWLGEGIAYREQAGRDLGERMAHAFTSAFQRMAERVIIIGTDCPEVTAGIVDAAYRALSKHDLVLGPAADGGYYLIGLRRSAWARAVPAIFEGVDWSTATVYQRTLDLAAAQNLSVSRLAVLEDVDRPEDLRVWRRAIMPNGERPQLSVIVPALNEERYIDDIAEQIPNSPGVEWIIADGGSVDRTVAAASAAGAIVVESPPGRARQMNLGAAKASADTLLFLHADTRLPDDSLRCIQDAFRRPDAVAGAFRFATDSRRVSMRLMEFGANLRTRWLKLPYGDQAIFVRTQVFRELGGYPELPIMEDYELVHRLRRKGKIHIAASPAQTSARRWHELGPWRTFFINQFIIAAYRLGVSPAWLAAFYQRRRNARGTAAPVAMSRED